MTMGAPSRASRVTAGLFLLVIVCLLLPVGGIIISAIADDFDPYSSPPQLVVNPDPVSDSVAAIAAEFRVDESGAATYSIPIYGIPGTAGVAPTVSLNYSSQAGYGPLGKGWSIGGLSSISRCRATREAGDFIVSGVPTDGDSPRPIDFSSSDRFCLDGQRLIPAQSGNAACPSVGGMTVQNLRTEIDTFQRVCAYISNAINGPAFFTVERKDGSTSWYGDRNSSTTANRPDGYFETNSPINPAAALLWAQTRFQDSTGNYIDFIYAENPAGAGTGEHLISQILYTGKTILSGQAARAAAPYAKIMFTYSARPAAQWAKGYTSGGVLTQTRRLDSITACASAASGCTAVNQARFYQLVYASGASGSGLDALASIQECSDSTKAVCSAATTFQWSPGKYEFATKEYPGSIPTGSSSKFEGFKMGDIDGDGRLDIVYLKDGSNGESCSTEYVFVLYSILDSSGRPSYTQSAPICTPAELMSGRGEGSWQLFDYNGDGRDDLFVSGPTGAGWRVYPSQGRTGTANFDTSQNLIAALSPVIPSQNQKNDQVQLADLNGDGLTDVVYPNGGALRARLMERQGTGFGWGAERVIAIDNGSLGPMPSQCQGFHPDIECSREIAGAPTPKTSFMQMADFNGDASSDLLIQVTTTIITHRYGTPGCPYEPLERSQPPLMVSEDGTWVVLPYTEQTGPGGQAQVLPPNPCVETSIDKALHAFIVKSITASAIGVVSYDVASPGDPETITFADANGDGLTDVFYRATKTSSWAYRINTGTGLQPVVYVPLQDFEDQVRFLDINGDGRADILHPFNAGGYKAYNVKLALPSGGFGPESWLPGAAGTNGNAMLCEGYACNQDERVPIFADLDGDGNLDFLSIRLNDNADMFVSRASSRFVARDVITKVTNGLGAVTDITYAPLTNAALYRRDSGTRNTTNWGRGAPVQDLLMPSYAVARAASSSPQAGSPNAMATVHYRYAGAKVQAGGRGFLGFREIITFDPNHAGGYVVTGTTYAQSFPFVGMPVSTVKRVVTGAYQIPACLAGVINDSCFALPGQAFPSVGGSTFSDSVHAWESDTEVAGNPVATFAPGVQAPVHVRTMGTTEILRDPFTGAQTSKVDTTFVYGSYGNVVATAVDTYTGISALTSTVLTSNTYADNVNLWRLGRLLASTVTHQRQGRADVVRTSGFNYSMGGAATGLMTYERAGSLSTSGDPDRNLLKSYVLDDYGNRTAVVVCADPATAAACTTAGLQFHPAAATTVRRYTRTVYDRNGRYPVATYEPFWTASGGVEQKTQTVLSRNIFGDVTEAYDLNGVHKLAIPGAMGRDYYSWMQTTYVGSVGDTSTGVRGLTTYRWCGSGTNQVSCPTGAKFRQQVMVTEAPTQWTYFDVLGRPIMTAGESFNAWANNKDVAASCMTYDATSKPLSVSTPFFLPGVAGSDGPTVAAATCTSDRAWTTTTYDVLGRPTQITAPDASLVTSSYSGLVTTVTDQRNNATTQTRNGKGELTQVVDANGLALTYAYYADGSLYYLTRDAGRGAITNYFYYDALGRKIQQTDPDSSTAQFQYNALGELIAQIDADGNRIENAYDARGRVWQKTVRLASGSIESQSNFVFDTAANGLGQLASESITGTYAGWVGQAGTALGFSRTYSYDTMGRPLGSSTTIDGVAYPAAAAYDKRGRIWKAQDASGRWTKTQFTLRGANKALCDSTAADADPACPNSSNTYLATLETDAWGHVVKERRGNSAAMEVSREYWASTGRLASLCAGNQTTCNLMDEGYGWDAAGNLSSHQKETRYLETFTYDALNRLKTGTLAMQDGITANTALESIEYDLLGNVCRRFQLGGGDNGFRYAGRAGCGLGGANSSAGDGGTGLISPHQVSQTYRIMIMQAGRPGRDCAHRPGNGRELLLRRAR